MFMRRFFNFRTTTVVLLALILSAVAYGFAAANTINGNADAGEGETTIAGYQVSNVDYTLNSSNPANFSSVGFNLYRADGTTNAPATTEVYVGIGDGSTTYWTTCTAGTLPAWSCDLTSSTVDVNAAVEFHVAAAD